MRGFEPGEINVKAEGTKLCVQAKHEESAEKGRKVTKHFNRQMDIPDIVDPDKLDAQLSADGILFVEAPIENLPIGEKVYKETSSYTVGPPKTMSLTPAIQEATSYDSNRTRIVQARTSPQPDSPWNMRQMAGGGRPSLGRYSNPLVVIVGGQRKLKLTVDIGEGYQSQDVIVAFKGAKIGVYAQHEETTPWRSVREFSREFDLPEEIAPSTLRAALSSDGRVVIGASCKDNSDHSAILESIMNDMPQDGEQCQIEL